MKASIIKKALLVLVIWAGGMTTAWGAGFTLTPPTAPVVPGDMFTIKVYINTQSYNVETYKIAISLPAGLAVPLWAQSTGEVPGFIRPITHDLGLTSIVEVEERHHNDSVHVLNTNAHIVDVIFLAKRSAAPTRTNNNTLGIVVEDVRQWPSGQDITSYFTTNYSTNVAVAVSPISKRGLDQYLDLSGNSVLDADDAEIARELVQDAMGNTTKMPLNIGGLQGDINGNWIIDQYDVGWLDALVRPMEYVSTGPDGVASTEIIVGSDDVQEIPYGHGLPHSPAIGVGSDSDLETTASADDEIEGNTINTGDNGICDTHAKGNDEQIIAFHKGTPYSEAISAGPNQVIDVSPVGDDTVRYYLKNPINLLNHNPPPGRPATIVKVSPKADLIKIRKRSDGRWPPIELAVQVLDSDGTPKVNVTPVFQVIRGNGHLDSGSSVITVDQVTSDSRLGHGAFPTGTTSMVFLAGMGANSIQAYVPGDTSKGVATIGPVKFNITGYNAPSNFPNSISFGSSQSSAYVGQPINLQLIVRYNTTNIDGMTDRIKLTTNRNLTAGVDATDSGYEASNLVVLDRFETTCPPSDSNWQIVSGGSSIVCDSTHPGRFGTRSVHIQGAGITYPTVFQRTVNMSEYKAINLAYEWGFTGDPTTGSYIQVDYSTDYGTSWKTLHYGTGQNGLKCQKPGTTWQCLPDLGYLEPLKTALVTDTAADRNTSLYLRFTFAAPVGNNFYLDNVSWGGMHVLSEETFEGQQVGFFPSGFETGQAINTGRNGICNTTADSGDSQTIQVGHGEMGHLCIQPGLNMQLDTPSSGDDYAIGDEIWVGPNGICDSRKRGDDYQVIDPPGNGLPFTECVGPGSDHVLTTTPISDDKKWGEMGPLPNIVVVNGTGHGGTKYVKITRSLSGPGYGQMAPYVLQKSFNLEGMENVWLFAWTRTYGLANYENQGVWSEPGQRWNCLVSDNGGRSFVPIWDSSDVEESSWTRHKVCLSCDPRIKMTDNIIVKWRAVMDHAEIDTGDPDAAYIDDIMLVGTPKPPDVFGPITDQGSGIYTTTVTSLSPGSVEIMATLEPESVPPAPPVTNPTKTVSFNLRKVDPNTVKILPQNFNIKACESLDLMVVGRYQDQPADQVSDIANLYKFEVTGPARITSGGHLIADCFLPDAQDPALSIFVNAVPLVEGLYDPSGGGSGQQTGYINGSVFTNAYPFSIIQGTSIRIMGQSNFSDTSASDGTYFRSGIPVYSSYTIRGIKQGKNLTTKTSVSVTAGSTTTANLYQASGNDADGDGTPDASDTDIDGDGLSNTAENAKGSSNYSVDTDEDDYPDSVDAFPTNPNEWVDTDGDTIGNNADTDDDGDSISDTEENTAGTDGYITNPLKADSDDDGLRDYREIHTTHTNPNVADTDGGCRKDGDEVNAGRDPNNAADDNYLPVVEAGANFYTINGVTTYLNGRSTTHADPASYDPVTYLWTKVAGPASVSITNSNQVVASFSTTTNGTYRFKLAVTDTCGSASDSVTIDVSNDSDGDGLSNNFENNVFSSNPNLADSDGDTITDLHEYWGGTDPNVVDETCQPGLSCYLDSDDDGNELYYPTNLDLPQIENAAMGGGPQVFPGVYPSPIPNDDLTSVLDIDGDGFTTIMDLPDYYTLVFVGGLWAGNGIPNSVVTVPAPFGTPQIALGETTTLTVEVKCAGDAGRAGVGVVFVVDSGPGQLLGGRGDASVYENPLSPPSYFPSGSRWAVTGPYESDFSSHSYATIKVKRTGSGTITVNAIVPYYPQWEGKGMIVTLQLATKFSIGEP